MYKMILLAVGGLDCFDQYSIMCWTYLCEDTMKLFQRLLVAPAALGLMAPVAANADTAAFTSTTALSGAAFFTVGSVSDGGPADNQEELYMQYAYGLDITSSFTGEDLLTAGIEAGNASGPLASMDSASDGGDGLNVTSLYYEFPVGDLAVTVGPLLDQDDVVAATTSKYSDAFRLGSMPFSLAGNETGPGIAVAYSNDSGVVASISFVSVGGTDSTAGIGADNGDDVSTFTLGYDSDNGWGGGIVLATNDGDGTTGAGYDTFGGGIYYTPESIPAATVSVAYDTTDPDTGADATDLFVGLDYEVGPGVLSAAYNSTDVDGSDSEDSTGFEVSYTYALNDNVTVTPGFFTVEDTSTGDDDTGVVVETAFSF